MTFAPLENTTVAIGVSTDSHPVRVRADRPARIGRARNSLRNRGRNRGARPSGGDSRMAPDYETVRLDIGSARVVLEISRLPIDNRAVISGKFLTDELKPANGKNFVEQFGLGLLGADQGQNDRQPNSSENALALVIATRLLRSRPIEASRNQLAPSAPPPSWFNRVICFIETHLAASITLAAMAKCAGITPAHFVAEFKAATGTPPREYVLRKRIERAQLLLRKSDLTLVDIALAVGFRSQSRLANTFGRMVGTSPQEWRFKYRRLTNGM